MDEIHYKEEVDYFLSFLSKEDKSKINNLLEKDLLLCGRDILISFARAIFKESDYIEKYGYQKSN